MKKLLKLISLISIGFIFIGNVSAQCDFDLTATGSQSVPPGTTYESKNGWGLPEYIANSGFADVKETKQYSTIFGTLSLYKANKA